MDRDGCDDDHDREKRREQMWQIERLHHGFITQGVKVRRESRIRGASWLKYLRYKPTITLE
jgi:hypothetical protein